VDYGKGPAAINATAVKVPRRSPEEIVHLRGAHFGPNLSISYRRPLKIVRGEAQYLFDESGRRYLDLVNNVCHVGHCHPHVVEAGQRQMAALNTNTRYLHDALAEYVVRLADTFPDPLSVCYLVCTGSEANDLALRLARAHTGSREIVVLDHAYHGNSSSLVEISPYTCEGAGGEGLAAHAHKVSCPDVYRGRHRGPDAAERYAEEVEIAPAGLVKEILAFASHHLQRPAIGDAQVGSEVRAAKLHYLLGAPHPGRRCVDGIRPLVVIHTQPPQKFGHRAL
jgi:4-aminobutyrate aminotransferase-like enzyme